MEATSYPLDDAQRESVRSEINSSMVVEAGAGTGKTTLLVDRIISLIENFNLNDIAAVTFTEKAADELIDRLRSRIEERLLNSGSKGVSIKMLRVLDEIDTAQVSTIHSFARTIIRERAFEAGLDPEFSMIEPDAEKLLVNDIISNELIRQDSQRDLWLKRFVHLDGRFEYLRELVLELYENRDLLENFNKVDDSVNLNEVFTFTSQTVRKLAIFAGQNCPEEKDPGRIQILNIENSIPDSSKLEEAEIITWMLRVASISPNKGVQRNWSNKDYCRDQKRELKILKSKTQEIISLLRRETLKQIVDWVVDLTEKINGEKRIQGLVGFQDLLIEARNLLLDPEVRRILQTRFKRLLIDEFQDTDPLQVEIAMLLAGQRAAEMGAFEQNLEPGKMCIVGDPKQSIYRFRRADPDIYGAAVEKVVKTGKKVEITQNFRSSPGIVDFVNVFFTRIWEYTNSGGIGYQSIIPDPKRPNSLPSPPVALITPGTNWDPGSANADEIRSAEADAFAKIIHLAHSDQEWKIYRKEDCKFNSPHWSDFAILFQTVTGIDIYAEALNRLDIPFQVEGGKRFFQQHVITELYSTLAAIDNPVDTLNVVAALRSGFFSIPDHEIMSWRESVRGELDYRQDPNTLPNDLKSAINLLQSLHTKRKEMRVDELMELLIRKTAFRQVIRSEMRTWIDEAALDRVLGHARKWGNENGFGLRGFKRWLSNRIEQSDDKGSGQLLENAGVRLMTIHSAKGLEFPIVLLANMSGGRFRARHIIANRLEKKIDISIGSKQSGVFKSKDFDKASELEAQADMAEKMRLLYVAMTRARDHLILPMFYREDSKGIPKGIWYQWLVRFFTEVSSSNSNAGKLWRLIEIPTKVDDSFPQAKKHTGIEGIESIWNDMKGWESDRRERLKKAISKIPQKVRPSDGDVDNPEAGDLSFERDYNGENAIRIGNALHKYMAQTHISYKVSEKLLKIVSEEERVSKDELLPLVKNCLANDIWHEICQAKRFWRETPVTANFDSGQLRGIIDVVWEDDQKNIHIVDYKTGQKDEKGHSKQINLYKVALEKAINMKVCSARLFYVKTCETVVI